MPVAPLGGQTCCSESLNFTRCIIDAAPMEKGAYTVCFEEIAFSHTDGFERSRIEGDIKLPTRQV